MGVRWGGEGVVGEERQPPGVRAVQGMTCDSCDSSVVVMVGWRGRQATRCAPPLIQLRHTAPCQTQQLDSSHSEDSIDLLSGGPVALPHNPALFNVASATPTHTSATPSLRAAIPADIRSPADPAP